ncbi:DUF1427 family protein [Actinomadura rupiterrae]|uniref:DUF1427 family protein n=1 Tax=Actinomadura rupiterrae TaxID=559627 RepID=UPI0020A5A58C|nr:DUF1427 family protein [Actinomadura rupiterrae]MCP2343232.1 XapX domain-containing protein [Actinomadura rupiterrae]
MKSVLRNYAISLAAGVLAGFLYWIMHVPTPAPPWRALVGLLGILAGESGTRLLITRLRRRGASSDSAGAHRN